MIDAILSRLEKVRATGRGTWQACCPAHADRSPSLSLRESEDGTVLAKCFAGCTGLEIMEATGLGFAPWFPPKSDADFHKPYLRPIPARDILDAVADDAMLIATTVANMAHGEKITPEEYLALLNAAGRLQEAHRSVRR